MTVILLAGPAPARAGEPPAAKPAPATSEADSRDLLEAAKATAKSARTTAENIAVVPDLLVQILTKLDKIEDKIARLETAMQAKPPARRDGR
ncbi:hypothetical protein [Chelatococcus reniformis]|uniref:hypothetical protein n=1 Tax=Chelatococcus reniformis TaxID=1494448 RepID=UPI00166E389F|nr:hypothetical protein [Chelatococcus reniformis]